jgi:hypothetical protein
MRIPGVHEQRYGEIVVLPRGAKRPWFLDDQHVLRGRRLHNIHGALGAVASDPVVVERELFRMRRVQVDVSGKDNADRTRANIFATVGANPNRPEWIRGKRRMRNAKNCYNAQEKKRGTRHRQIIAGFPVFPIFSKVKLE